MSELLNKPRCKNFDTCGQYALTLFMERWLCGECFAKALDRVKKIKEKLIFDE